MGSLPVAQQPFLPTRRESRLLILLLLGMWLLAPGADVAGVPEPLIGIALVVGVIAFSGVTYRIAGREIGCRPLTMWLWWGWDATRANTRMLVETVRPRWYRAMVRAAGWNPRLTGAALTAGLVCSTVWALSELV